MGAKHSMTDPQFILASASPRRAQLLDQLGLRYTIEPADIDETAQPDETAADLVLRLAQQKAQCVANNHRDELSVLGADTIVVTNGNILGKPANQSEMLAMMAQLSQNTHEVITAIALINQQTTHSAISTSQVTFRTVSMEERLSYWRSGEPIGKAGGYAIQGLGASFIQHLQGSYSGVMGLPLYETSQLLMKIGIDPLDGDKDSTDPKV